MIEPTDETLRRWLLRKLPPAQAEALESRLLTDEDFGESLRAAETDLLDDYARGALSADDHAIATGRFASTSAYRMRLRIARALARITRRSSASAHGVRTQRHAAAAAPRRWRTDRRIGTRRVVAVGLFASACAVGIVAIGLNSVGLNRRVASFPPQVAGVEATITLLADRQRGANVERIALPRGATMVRLQAEIEAEDPHARYALDIEDAGHTVFSATDIAARNAGPYRFVEVVFDARKLGAGSHRVHVFAQGSAAAGSTWMLETRSE